MSIGISCYVFYFFFYFSLAFYFHIENRSFFAFLFLDRAYMIEDKDYQFQCCGVVSSLNYNSNGGSVTLQIWRQKDDTDFELISSQQVNVGE